ncbi:MAG: sigma-70 family RNA polymerase sigma factor [Taibaiella sp.]|nr:sigma-70 family RNA polymerase sigma factor [Taibaiella sp.]
MSSDRNTNPNFLEPAQWINRYSDLLHGFVCSRIADTIAAQDVVQEVFYSAWKAKDNYKGQSSEKNWLFAICKNKITDYYRKQAKEIMSQLTEIEASGFFNGADHWREGNAPNDWGINYNQTIETKEFYHILELCKNKLQQLQRAVFVLKYMDEMDSDKICKELEISPSYYWTLMHRAKLQLRTCIEKNWFGKK